MGKKINVLLGISLAGLCFFGWCNRKGQNTITEQQTNITGLETKVKKYSEFSERLKEKLFFYSDSLGKTIRLYNGSVSENEKLNKKVSELSKRIKKEGRYNFLASKYDVLKNEKDKLFGLYQKEVSKNQELTSLLTKNSDFSKSKYSNSQQSKEAKKKFNAKNQNFFRNWKSISPRLFSIGEESISFKDNDSKEMEAFARYESGRLIPLKKLEDSDKCSSFYLPYIDFDKGTISVYAIDKDKNQSKEYSIYISGGVVSKKKFE